MFQLDIKTDNEAFSDDPSLELARILLDVAARIETGSRHGPVFDVNGNRVGQFTIDRE